jgi:hypothetical protein
VTHGTSPPDERETIELKDPAMAALLAWLIPGLGHLYQGRTAKAILFFVCIMGTFTYGLYLGGSSKLGWGRVVYASWSPDDTRLPYLCQIGVGLPAVPALIQAIRVRNGKAPWGDFMAPPRRANGAGGDAKQPTLDDLKKDLDHAFELGTVYTMIAGLLNVLAIYDAWGGPVFAEARKKEEGEDQQEDRGPDESQQEVPAGAES